MAGNDGDFDEGVDGVLDFFDGANDTEGFEMGGEFGPGGEAVFAGEDKLGVGEGDGGELVGDLVWGHLTEAGVSLDALNGGRIVLGAGAE